MKTFKDNLGRSWLVDVNVTGIKRVRDLIRIDLYKVLDDEARLLHDLLADPVLLIDTVYVLCKDQCDRESLSGVRVGEAMGGDALEGAGEALLNAIVDFFPNARGRKNLQRVLEKGKQIQAKVISRGELLVEEIDVEAEAEKWLARLRRSSGNSPADSV